MKTFSLLTFVVIALLLLLTAHPRTVRSAPSTQPSTKYRLTRQGVAGLTSPQFVFIIVTPEDYPWVATYEKLQWMVEKAVPAGGTLDWNPGCERIGGEPLETAEEVDGLKAFCSQHGIHFVQQPGG